ncbi:hypothetical protein LMF32_11985 [Desemzia sp. C1]|uniref:hypothetical protein n=1 Tax=Desemzia sp. C1 TaxID=2892016 RepID=UPI001E617403|nr:hypothetical protein [Desemzia sp. C1]MCI3029764.1 hypothetical protein [Desemzia sp. C1]
MDAIDENFKKIALVQQYRNKELKEAVYPIKTWFNHRCLKTQEEIQEEINNINQKYDEAVKNIYINLNKELKSKGFQPYGKGE